MPFKVTKMNYLLFFMSMSLFLFFFFFYRNIAMHLCCIFCIYEMFAIVVLPGKPRLREMNIKMRLYGMLFLFRDKIRGGWDEYDQWKKRRE